MAAVFALAVFDFAEARLDLLPMPVRAAALLLLVRRLAFRCGGAHCDLLIPLGPRRCGADTDVLALAANQSERNQGQSRAIAAYLAPIRQFLPDRARILGLGSNGCRKPKLRRAGVLLNGARRIRTADLLGAI
ncbi:MAG TPA: hypothetical protein VF125_02950 [Solirubrobacterales bacterium]